MALQALVASGYLTGRGSEADWWQQLQAGLGPLGMAGVVYRGREAFLRDMGAALGDVLAGA